MPFCGTCGKEIAADVTFCTYCGSRVGTGSSAGNQVSAPISGQDAFNEAQKSELLLQANDIVMKKKILSLTEHYDFEDRGGRKLGEGDGNFFQFPARFVIYAMPDPATKTEIIRIEGKLISLRHEFSMFDPNGKNLGTMKKKIMKLIGEEYWLEQNGVELMRVYGNFTEHDYRMGINGQEVGQVHKKWISVRDQFGISITGDVDPRLVLGAAIVVEHVEVTERNIGNS